MTDAMTKHDIEVAIGCLDRAVHAGTSDAEVLAAVGAWRRKTGKRLVREVCEGYFGGSARRWDATGYARDRRLEAENRSLREELDNWRREAVKWHEEYQRVFTMLTPKETRNLYEKVERRQQQTDGPKSRFSLFKQNAGAAVAFCAAFFFLFLAAKWLLSHVALHL